MKDKNLSLKINVDKKTGTDSENPNIKTIRYLYSIYHRTSLTMRSYRYQHRWILTATTHTCSKLFVEQFAMSAYDRGLSRATALRLMGNAAEQISTWNWNGATSRDQTSVSWPVARLRNRTRHASPNSSVEKLARWAPTTQAVWHSSLNDPASFTEWLTGSKLGEARAVLLTVLARWWNELAIMKKVNEMEKRKQTKRKDHYKSNR